MCHICDKEVIEMGILESDLPNLPFKLLEWYCMVEGCHCKTKLRDYGIAPYYFWAVKITRTETHWRGGWLKPDHGYICSKHFPQYKKDPNDFMWKNGSNEKYPFSKISPIIKKVKK